MKGEVTRSGNFIEFNGDICSQTGALLLKEIEQALREEALHLTLLISSGGGICEISFMLYEKIKELLRRYSRDGKPIPLWTYGVGNIASAAVILFSVGDRRCISRNAQLLFHEMAVIFKPMMGGTPASEIRDTLVQIQKDGCFCENEAAIFLLKGLVEGELRQKSPDMVLVQECNVVLGLVERGVHCCSWTPVMVNFLQTIERRANKGA